ncbi:MAG: hypothetical protein IKS84_00835 [Lachnospiraceae bacterium]|nr:hypothetical protein [Lachnospiraceae bacterium]MBR6486303.1 hypothetical protein [Lachnospiraceae bacterium]
MKSIFEQIDEVVRLNGYVTPEFYLDNSLRPGEAEPRFKGEQEGLIGRPAGGLENDMLSKAFDMIAENVKINARLAVHNFDDRDPGFKVALIRGQLLKMVIDNIDSFDPHKLSTLAYSLVMFGTKTETVKLGLLLLVLFDFADDEIVKKHLVTIGLYEEFTSYILSNVKGWPENERNRVYYVYAQKLTGWGKINAVEMLDPADAEIREWILKHGCRNEVSYGWLGKTAYEKSGFANRLKDGDLDEEEMQGARDIMRGLLDEGPIKGISEIEHPARLAMLYLKELSKHKVKLDDAANMFELKEFILKRDNRSTAEDRENAVKLLDRLIGLSEAEKMIRGGVVDDPGLALYAAGKAGIDVSGELMEQLKYSFPAYYKYGYYFLENGAHADEYINICEKNLTALNLVEGMGTDEPDPDSELNWRLDAVIRQLSPYPGRGVRLVTAALNSSILIYRQAAARVLKDWEKAENANIKKMNPELLKTVKKLKKKEVDSSLKKEWDEILDYK